MAKIVIDARHFGPSATGIGRYTAHLLDELQKIDRMNEYVVFLKKSDAGSFRKTAPNFRIRIVDAPIYTLKEQVLVLKSLWEEKPDLVHFPHFNVPVFYFGRFIVTIHDLIVSEFGGTEATTLPLPLYLIKRLAYNLALRKAVYASKKIFVPSHFVRKKILSCFKIPEEKITVTYEAAGLLIRGSKNTRRGGSVASRFKLSLPFFLYVGNVYPHKNVNNLLSAIEMIKTNLVVVSPRNVFLDRLEKEINRRGLSGQVRILGFVSDADLIKLYQEAVALVFPSLSEGFGIPAVEAMSLGCPVVLANASSLPEIGGEAALYFDPMDPKDISENLKKVLDNGKIRRILSEKGQRRAKKFSWEKMAKETFGVYKALLASDLQGKSIV